VHIKLPASPPLQKLPLPLAFVLLTALPAWAVDAYLPPHTGSQGCWVSIFGEDGYRGPRAQLTGRTYAENFRTGPVVDPDLRDVGGQSFFRAIDSMVVGPNARVIAYAGGNFSGIELVLRPGTTIADLDIVNFGDRIESLKVQCVE
jgi:hypothetical protein